MRFVSPIIKNPIFLGGLLLLANAHAFALTPDRVLVVYSSTWLEDLDGDGTQDSLEVAQYYAQKRGIPSSNLLGLPISDVTSYNRGAIGDFTKLNNEVLTPILNKLTALGPTNIDSILLCYGVPLQTLNSSAQAISLDNALMGINYWSTTANNIFWTNNSYRDSNPGFHADFPHFDHAAYKFSGKDMYMVSRLDGPGGVTGTLDRIDQTLYAERYFNNQPGYYRGTAYVDAADNSTDAQLAALPAIQNGDYSAAGGINANIAWAEHHFSAAAFPLQWEVTSNRIGDPGSKWTDGTPALTAPRTMFYDAVYTYFFVPSAFDWLPGSVGGIFHSYDIGSFRAGDEQADGLHLKLGLTCTIGTVNEPYTTGVEYMNTLFYYLLKGYPFAEAAALASPSIGWQICAIGDPLYTPFRTKTAVMDTTAPTLAAGYPFVSLDKTTGDSVANVFINDTGEPDVVKIKFEYGPDTNYGTTIDPIQGYWRRFQFRMPGLTPGKTYHYRMTITDPVGNVTVTGDYSFTTAGVSPFQSSVIPGTIQFEDFDNGGSGVAYYDTDLGNAGGKYRSTDVDIFSTNDSGGGYYVGNSHAGEWMDYTADVAGAGLYTVRLRVASLGVGGTFHIECDRVDKTGPILVPDSGAWDSWQTISKVINLTAGHHVLRVMMDTQMPLYPGVMGNFNFMDFSVCSANSAPVAQNQTVATNINTARPLVLAATDPDGNQSSFTVLTAPTHGTLSGTAPYLTYTPTASYSGLDSFTFKANDGVLDSGNNGTISINVNNAMTPQINSALSVKGTVGTALNYTIAATNTPTSFSASGLPAPLSLDTTTGKISGTPISDGTFTVGITATNAGGTDNAALTLTIAGPVPTIGSAASASGNVGSAFSYQITANNNASSFYATGLPPELSINTATGLIGGNPTLTGTFMVVLGATNRWGTGVKNLALSITGGNPSAPSITSGNTATATVGVAFLYQITASNSPTSFSASGLPNGLTFDAMTGIISGIPSDGFGVYYVMLAATNGAGTGEETLTLTVKTGAPVLNTTWNSVATVGTPYQFQIIASNNPTSYSAPGLPAGLSLDASSGLISGTPTVAGNFYPVLSASNQWGTGVAGLSLTVSAPPNGSPVITSAVRAGGSVGTPFSYTITANNAPTSFTADPLPAGFTFNANTGVISGHPITPSVTDVQLSATNATGTGTTTLVITISPIVPVITSALTVSGVVNTNFSYSITATNSPTSFNASGLPPELSIDTARGIISGTPTTAMIRPVTLSATNANGTGTATLSLSITTTGDTTPPVISGVSTSGLTTTAVTINWTTNEASDSQVEYGITPTYGNFTTINTTPVLNHSQLLSGLAPGTPYYYQVKSRDVAGNLATSGQFTFTTKAVSDTTPPAVPSGLAGTPGDAQATLTWIANTESDLAGYNLYRSDSQNGTYVKQNASLITSPRFTQTGLTNGTAYWYELTAVDKTTPTPNESAKCAAVSVTPTAAPQPPQLFINAPGKGANLTGTTVTLLYTRTGDQTNVAMVVFQLDGGSLLTDRAMQGSFSLTDVPAGSHNVTAYLAKSDNSKISGTDASVAFTTQLPLNTTPPMISNIAIASLVQNSVVITWTTDVPADSQMDFGLMFPYGNSTTLNAALVTSHGVSLSGLLAGTLYHYAVKSRNAAGILATSPDGTFTTPAAESGPPESAPQTTPNISVNLADGTLAPAISGTVTLYSTHGVKVFHGQIALDQLKKVATGLYVYRRDDNGQEGKLVIVK